MSCDPEEPKQEDDYSRHYMQNDGLCPIPSSGPRVLVGFWAIDDVPTGTKPEVP